MLDLFRCGARSEGISDVGELIPEADLDVEQVVGHGFHLSQSVDVAIGLSRAHREAMSEAKRQPEWAWITPSGPSVYPSAAPRDVT